MAKAKKRGPRGKQAKKRKTSTRNVSTPWLELPDPVTRKLQIYAFDPSAGNYVGNRITVKIPWEPLKPGPVGSRVAVIDYDGSNKCYYPPVDLDNPLLLARDGIDPSESDPRFHQQMVYAVASKIIDMFEVALGRSIHWRRADRSRDKNDDVIAWRKSEDIKVLNLYPHAMQQANAYYSPAAHGILFGYFTANETGQGNNLPGQRIFTCLSHDIVAHEVTHAIIDGIRTYFTEPTNPDVLAFHEGFADLAALFSHFSMTESLVDTIQRTGGRLYEDGLAADVPSDDEEGGQAQISGQIGRHNPLVQLALQFGEASGAGHGLRTALGTKPNSNDINTRIHDPHFRGSILVAAVFDAYFTVYMSRATNLFRIFKAGGGTLTNSELPGPLANQLAQLASETATYFFRLCARSLDYCPAVDVTFGDFLRALITVATDLDDDDELGVRVPIMQAFRLRGIYPENASFFSEDALCWPHESPETWNGDSNKGNGLEGLIFGGPAGLTRAEKDSNGDVLRAWAKHHRTNLGLDPKLPIAVPSFHSVHRILDDGRLHADMVVEVVQSTVAYFDPDVPESGSFPLRGGATVIIGAPKMRKIPGHGDAHGVPQVRFAIRKALVGDERARREDAQRTFAQAQGFAQGDTTEDNHFQANFGLLHEEK